MDAFTSSFKPHPSECGRSVKLSAIDHIAPRDYLVVFFFFRLSPTSDKARIFQELEQGLFATTQQIPEILCSVSASPGDRDELQLLFDDDAGAAVSYKDYASGSLSRLWRHGRFQELEREHFPYCKLESKLLLAPVQLHSGRKRSLALQANFIDGGLILSTRIHVSVTERVRNDVASNLTVWLASVV